MKLPIFRSVCFALLGAFLLLQHEALAQVSPGPSPNISSVAGGDLSGSYPNPTVASIGGKAVTLGGALTTSGAFATTITATGTTTVTLPTSGTLVNSAVTSLSSLATVGTVTSGAWQGTPVAATYGGTGTASGFAPGAQRVLCSIRTANMNTTADQACTIAAAVTAWAPTAIWCTNASTSLTTAAGGWYPTTAKGGTPLVANAQIYTALSASTVILPLTLAANIATTRYAVNTIYLSLTLGQGGAATADCYVIGVDLT